MLVRLEIELNNHAYEGLEVFGRDFNAYMGSWDRGLKWLRLRYEARYFV